MVLHYVNSIDFFGGRGASIRVNHCEKIAFLLNGFNLNLIILIIPQSNYIVFHPYIPGDTEYMQIHSTQDSRQTQRLQLLASAMGTLFRSNSTPCAKPLTILTQVLFWNTSCYCHNLDPVSVFASSFY